MDLGLQDKHAIVTGGSRGIGKAIARELAREGADVAIMARNDGNLSGGARNAGLVHMTKTLAVQFGCHGITVIASIPARPAPSARRACSPPAPPSWAYPRKRRSGRTSLRTRRGAMPSAAWWTLRRSRSSRSSWHRIRPGRSPASWWRQAAEPGGRYITEPTHQAEVGSPPEEIWDGQGA